MNLRASTGIVMEAFDAVERRDGRRLAQLYHSEVEFHWPPSVPYGGTFRGIAAQQDRSRTVWDQVWDPLQPTEQERRMDPRVVAATEREVVVLWHQRGLQPAGQRLDMETLGLYGVAAGNSPGRRCSTSTPQRCSASSSSRDNRSHWPGSS
jgi:ketosteroid isomerase-like protein